jgi:aspartate kinase
MENCIVSKFGGSSLANAEQIKKVRDITASDADRKYIIVSAPGKDEEDDFKVTDHLINVAMEGKHLSSPDITVTAKESFNAVINKFKKIITDLNIEGEEIIKGLTKDLNLAMLDSKRKDFLASRGEHYNAKILTAYFNKSGISAEAKLPEDIGLVVTENFSDAKIVPVSYKNLKKNTSCQGVSIIPGFYGITESKDIAVFSRGGSDLTGGEIAYAMNASLYENWSDIDGIFQADPRIIKKARVIPRLTYKEIRLLASKGFNVFHYDAMVRCKKKGIPINIRNTNNPSAEGTMIVAQRVPEEVTVGIARMDNIAYLYLEKDGSQEIIGFVNKVLNIMKDYGIETYHYPTDKDDVAVIMNQEDLIGCEDDITETIKKELDPDNMEFFYNLSIISPVGIGMRYDPGVIAEAALAMKNNNINIEIIDQGPAQISFHLGIQGYYANNALNALYDKLIQQ